VTVGDDMGSAQETAGASAPLVLVVDDNRDTLVICARTLKAAGYRTATAASGEEGLALIEALKPALVVLDLAMPGMDGFTTAHRIRSSRDASRTPILVFTGLATPEMEVAARRAGGTAFCTKPLEPKRLLAEVRRLCPVA
jgi:DNA-binding response OmpR family regulator